MHVIEASFVFVSQYLTTRTVPKPEAFVRVGQVPALSFWEMFRGDLVPRNTMQMEK